MKIVKEIGTFLLKVITSGLVVGLFIQSTQPKPAVEIEQNQKTVCSKYVQIKTIGKSVCDSGNCIYYYEVGEQEDKIFQTWTSPTKHKVGDTVCQ